MELLFFFFLFQVAMHCVPQTDLSIYGEGLGVTVNLKGLLRPVSTQENKHRIGSDSFSSCIIHTAG